MLKRLGVTRLFIVRQQGGRPKVAALPVVLDTFTDANGTQLTAHTPDIAPAAWAYIAASLAINSNKATGAAGTNTIDAGIANARVYVYFTGTTGYLAVYGRFYNTANMWQVKVTFSTNTIELIETTANVSTTRATLSKTVSDGQPHAIVFTLAGDTLSFTVDGDAPTPVSFESSSHNNRTKYGLTSSAAGSSFDTFKLEKL